LTNDLLGANSHNLLDVLSNVAVSQVSPSDTSSGKIIASEVRNSGVDRFSPDLITGNTLVCPPGQILNYIHSGVKQCSTVAQTNVVCPVGQAAYGVNADGTISCRSFTGCPSMAVNICPAGDYDTGIGSGTFHAPDTILTVNAGQEGDIQHVDAAVDTTIDPFGSISATLKCVSGTWALVDGTLTGRCHCRPRDDKIPVACQNVYGAGLWTGMSTTDHTVVCPSGDEGYHNDEGIGTPTPCTCVNGTVNQTVSCPDGFTGTGINQSRNWHCTSSTEGDYTGPWTETSRSCTCTAGSHQTQVLSCPQGYAGEIDQKRTIQCPAGTWSAWTTTLNTCTCDPSANTQDRTVACPAGQTGNILQRETLDCNTGVWGAWTVVSNNCTAAATHWASGGSVSHSATQSGPVLGDPCSTAGSYSTCSTPASGGYTVYSHCVCQ
jgi:hypothetical protein